MGELVKVAVLQSIYCESLQRAITPKRDGHGVLVPRADAEKWAGFGYVRVLDELRAHAAQDESRDAGEHEQQGSPDDYMVSRRRSIRGRKPAHGPGVGASAADGSGRDAPDTSPVSAE